MDKGNMIQNVRFALSLYGNFGEYEERILEAINKISRIFFVENAEIAYLDTALPIGEGQTISQPSTVARMLQLLELKHGEEVLEIGAGSGWNACLIAYLVKPGKILSLERHEKLIGFAKRNLRKTQIKNVKFKNQDFRKIKIKFDKIIFTAGINPGQEEIILDFAKKSLKEEGKLICPFQAGSMIIIDKKGEIFNKNYSLEEYSFVPLILE